MRALAAYVLVLIACLWVSAQDARVSVDRVVVYKHARKLVLLYRGQELRSYRLPWAANQWGGTRQGDHRTPEGVYVLDSRNPNSPYYKAFHVSYPSAKDKAVARKLGVSPGGDIMVHGLPKEYAWVGKSRVLHDWTDGCIAVTNEEMDELWNLVRVEHSD